MTTEASVVTSYPSIMRMAVVTRIVTVMRRMMTAIKMTPAVVVRITVIM